jgi:predicted aspartyl protease
MKPTSAFIAALVFGAFTFTATAQQAASFRRYTTRDGKTFYAAVLKKDDLSVSFKLQDGRGHQLMIKELSQPDQLFVRKWTKFKDDLMSNAQFAKLTVKEMLEMRGYQSFEFDIQGNHIYVEGEMNGKKTRFMVDTGADTSLLHTAAAKDAGVEMGPFDREIRGVAGSQPAAVCKVTSIKLGDAVIENRKILAADLGRTGGGTDFDAIFGADFLRELDAVISYREGRMFLKPDNIKSSKPAPAGTPGAQPPAVYAEWKWWTTNEGKKFQAALVDKSEKEVKFRMQNGTIHPWAIDKLGDADKDVVANWDKLKDSLAKNPEWRTLTVKELLELRAYQSFAYRSSGNSILVDGTVGSTKATFCIDTGAYSGLFDLKFAKSAGLEVGPMDQKVVGIGGEAPAALTKVARLTMGDAVIENRVMLSCELFKNLGFIGDKGDHDGLFGADFLRELDGVISYKEGRIFLRPDNSDKKTEEPKPADGAKPAEGKPAEPAKPAEPKPADPAKPATPPPAAPPKSAGL